MTTKYKYTATNFGLGVLCLGWHLNVPHFEGMGCLIIGGSPVCNENDEKALQC